VVVAYIRTVKTAGKATAVQGKATAVQIVHSNRRGSCDIEHIGSAPTPDEVEALKAAAPQRLHAGQDTLDLGDGRLRRAGTADHLGAVEAAVGRVVPGLEPVRVPHRSQALMRCLRHWR
jgi:hypothetical protein